MRYVTLTRESGSYVGTGNSGRFGHGSGVYVDNLDDLPTPFREAIVLCDLEGMAYAEAAQALDCPIGTVRSRIFRAREAISARVKPLLDNQSGKRW